MLTIEKFFQPSARLKAQLEAVIEELDKDTMLEIASGVAQVNLNVEKIVENLAPNRTSFSEVLVN